MGLLKYKLYKHAIPVTIVEPAKVKKCATGKGNADKQKMYEQFTNDTSTNLMKVFDIPTLNNPIAVAGKTNNQSISLANIK